jgi:lysophospholipase L1-like esterase
MTTVRACLILVICWFAAAVSAGEAYVPEPGSNEAKKKGNEAPVYDPALPNVLIIGDSISLGYTPFVVKLLAGKANVIHAPGNSQGTTFGLTQIHSWLKPYKEKPWAVIHFNWGLHDLKHINASTKAISDKAEDPPQADLATYTTNLTTLTSALVATGAQLIFATTTPYPSGVSPFRDPADAERYNNAARSVVGKHNITINDLHGLVAPKLDEFQLPKNVHFKPSGSNAMAEEVVKAILGKLAKP